MAPSGGRKKKGSLVFLADYYAREARLRLPAKSKPTISVSHPFNAPPPPLLGAVTLNVAAAEPVLAPAGAVVNAPAAPVTG